jgi:hypothetical protein
VPHLQAAYMNYQTDANAVIVGRSSTFTFIVIRIWSSDVGSRNEPSCFLLCSCGYSKVCKRQEE